MCEKRPLSKREAQEALNWIRRNRGRKSMKKRLENRYYFCPECQAWHLTKTRSHDW